MPGNELSFGRRRAMIWSAEAPLIERFQSDKTASRVRAGAASASAERLNRLHAGIALDDLCQARESLPCIAWNDMLWSPMKLPFSRPVSCCGKNPFGHDDEQVDVEAERGNQRSPARWPNVPSPSADCARRFSE